MKKSAILIALSLIAVGALFVPGRDVAVAPALAQTPSACTIPSAPAATADQTAWQLFVAVNCRAPNGKFVWETWIEQSQLYPANGLPPAAHLAAAVAPVRHLHGSVLAALLHRTKASAGGLKTLALSASDCSKMGIRPPNVVPKAVICEEVYVKPSAQATLVNGSYEVRTGQMAAAASGTKISFPSPAIEVKVDWLPASDFAKPPFSCTAPTTGLYVEKVNGVCYALVAMHITSKLLPDWLWTTFEPQNATTNPYRCTVYGPCKDAWGATPAVSSGPSSTTTLTQPLVTLMQQANLPTALQNYRLVGAQTDFVEGGAPIIDGNSIIEYEAASVPPGKSSCITCHSMSSINAQGVDGGSFFCPIGSAPNCNPNPIGPAVVLPTGFIPRAFLWSMALACPDPTGTGFQTCKTPKKPPK